MAEMAPRAPSSPTPSCTRPRGSRRASPTSATPPSAAGSRSCAGVARPRPVSVPRDRRLYTQLSSSSRTACSSRTVCRSHRVSAKARSCGPSSSAGCPGRGPCHLHNLIRADPALRSLPYWERLEPVLPDAERPVAGELPSSPRPHPFGLEVINQALPYFNRMHEMTVDHVHEEIALLAIDLSTMFFETQALMPSWRDDSSQAAGPDPAYRYLRTVLQMLQSGRRGGTRWVLESPSTSSRWRCRAVFPDATFVVTHATRSRSRVLATMIAYTARMPIEQVDPMAIGHYWSARREDLFGVRRRSSRPARRPEHRRLFDEFMAADIAMVERASTRWPTNPSPPDARGPSSPSPATTAARHGTRPV